jgi:hypothetical protein
LREATVKTVFGSVAVEHAALDERHFGLRVDL